MSSRRENRIRLANRTSHAKEEIRLYRSKDNGRGAEVMDKDGSHSSFPQIWNQYLSFENYSRNMDVGLDLFLATWQEKMYAAQSAGFQYSDIVLACKLLEKANLSQDVAYSILSSIDFSETRGHLLSVILAKLEIHSMNKRVYDEEDVVKIEVGNSIENDISNRRHPSTQVPDTVIKDETGDRSGLVATSSQSATTFVMGESSSASPSDPELSDHANYALPKCPKCSHQLHNKIEYEEADDGDQEAVPRKGRLSCQHCGVVLILNEIPSKEEPEKTEEQRKQEETTESEVCDSLVALSETKVEMDRQFSSWSSNAFQCEVCGKYFPRQSSLQAHLNIHKQDISLNMKKPQPQTSVTNQIKPKEASETKETGEPRYLCTYCGKDFSQYYYYRGHTKIHTGEKKYKCEECDISYTHYFSLVYHRRKHSGERPFKCDQCDRAFITSSKLTEHMRSHTGEKPYKCNVCDKAFASSKSRKRHLKLHSRSEGGDAVATGGYGAQHPGYNNVAR